MSHLKNFEILLARWLGYIGVGFGFVMATGSFKGQEWSFQTMPLVGAALFSIGAVILFVLKLYVSPE